MEFVCVNHHLIQEGDTYGLIYALLLNESLGVGGFQLYGLFYIDADAYEANTDGYRDKVHRRQAYFSSFGLTERRRLLVVHCHFTDKENLLSAEVVDGEVHVHANEILFNKNPRRVSLFLTDKENDPGGDLDKLLSAIGNESEKARQHASSLFTAAVTQALSSHDARSMVNSTVGYRYISYSTDYIKRCVSDRGVVIVTKALRASILSTTKEYTKPNAVFLDLFMERLVGKYAGEKRQQSHYKWHQFTSASQSDQFLVLLFWIRGAKADEHNALFKISGSNVGKPQHHTNMTLYKYVRNLARTVSERSRKPVLFVPIGDELKDMAANAEVFGYTKGQKEHNLIKFFTLEPFKGKPMGAQMNFLLQLAMKYQVVQVGMRSGSMERLMYLGVPTIYFDRTRKYERTVRDPTDLGGQTKTEKILPDPVGDARIKQLCGFQKEKSHELMGYFDKLVQTIGAGDTLCSGFPLFFHIENADTGFLKYSDVQETRVQGKIQALLEAVAEDLKEPLNLAEYNELKSAMQKKNYLLKMGMAMQAKKYLVLGGLGDEEATKLSLALWFIGEIYPYYTGLYDKAGKREVNFQGSSYNDDFVRFKAEAAKAERERLAHKQQLKENNDNAQDGASGIWW